MSTQKKLLLLAALLLALFEVRSQGVGIGVETPNPNAVLELVSPTNNQGLLVPKLTTEQRTAASFINNLTAEDNGLLVYDSDENAFYFWINSQWMSMQTAVNVTAGEGIQIVNGEISNSGDLDATNEIQDISLAGSQLSISSGSTLDLSTLDTDTQLSEAEVDAFVSNNGFISTESDPSVPTNLKDGVDWNEVASIPADLADGDDDTQLTEAEVDAFANNNGYLTTEVDGSVTNEIQDLQLIGNVLSVTNNANATDIDLSPFAGTNTDEQDLSFDGATIGITDGAGIDVSTWDTNAADDFSGNYADLSGLPANLDTDATDDFDGEFASLSNVPAGLSDGDDVDDADSNPTNEIQDLELVGNTLRITNNVSATDIDLAPFMGTNTDEQTLSLTGNDLTISGGNTIDISSIDTDTDTDDQTLAFDGTNLSIADGNSVDISSLSDGTGTDDQTISFDGTNISIEGGNSVDISAIDTDTDTDDQTLAFDGTNLSIADGNSVDISALSDGTGTDDQTISFDGTNISIEGGNSVDISAIDTDTDTDDQTLAFDGTNLSIADGNSVDISALSDGTGTDDQTISFDGTNISIEGGNSVDISAIDTDTDTDDQTLAFDGTNLSIADGNSVDISALSDGTGTDDQVAAEVGVTAGGDLTSTNVQDALEELQGEIVAAASAAIPDGAVTEQKIAAGAVTDVKVSDVAFSKLTGVPAGLADGDDVGITSETDPTVPANLKDGVDYSEITSTPTIPANTSDLTNDSGFITTESDPTVLASVKDGIVWSEVGSIPADIADGDDVGITSETDPTVPANLKDGVDYSEITGTPTIPANTSDLTNDSGFITTESDPTVLASVKDGIVWSEVGSIPADIADGDDVGITSETDPTVLASVKDGIVWSEVGSIPADIADGDDVGITSETDPTVPANLKDGVDYSEITSTPTIPANTSDLTNDSGFITTESDPTVLASVKDGIVWSEVGSIPADIADGDADNQNLSFISDPATISISGGTGIDVSSWDLNSADDFFLPATESFNTGANILDLTNNGGGITAVFDRNNSFSANPALRAFNGASGPAVDFDQGRDGDGDLIAVFRSQGNMVASINDLGQFVGDGSQLTNLPSGSWNSLADIPAGFADDTDDVNDADADASNEFLDDGSGLSGNVLRLFEGSGANNVNIDLSQFAELPAQSGNSGSFLTTNGTTASWASVPSSQWNTSGSDINYTTGNVGIGTTTPNTVLSLKGVQAPGDSQNEGVFMELHNDAGVAGYQTGIRFKVNSVDADQRFNAAIINRINASSQQELNFAIQPNDAENVGANDIKMTIDQDGDVGIGTTSPNNKLTVQGATASSTAPLLALQDQSGSGDASMNFTSQGGGNFTLGLDDSDDQFKLSSGGALGSSDLMSVNGSNQFVFGGGAPININTGYTFRFTNTGFGGMYMTSSGNTSRPFYGYVTNTTTRAYHYVDGSDGYKWKLNVGGDRLTVTASGDIGAGTTDPSADLDVVGDTELNGQTEFNGRVVKSPSSTIINVNTSTFTLSAPTNGAVLRIQNGSNISNARVTGISSGVDGQELIIINVDGNGQGSPNALVSFIRNAPGTGTSFLMDGSSTGGNTVNTYEGSVLKFIYSSDVGAWLEVSRSINYPIQFN